MEYASFDLLLMNSLVWMFNLSLICPLSLSAAHYKITNAKMPKIQI